MGKTLPTTIQEVLQQLDDIIEETIQQNNRLGIFAYIYRRTTAAIQKAIEEKRFEDNARMEKFDVVFANRYLQAYYDFKNNQTVSQSWLTSFQVKDKKLTIIQHLIMGMNAHISFDLGIAAEEIAANGELKKMEKDFLKVNEILIEITGEMQDKINRVSKLMFLLDWFGARKDEKVIEFGMVTARDFAWKFAVGLSVIDGKGQPALIQETDQIVADINRHIQRPKRKITHFTLRLVSFFETKNVKKIIQKLKS